MHVWSVVYGLHSGTVRVTYGNKNIGIYARVNNTLKFEYSMKSRRILATLSLLLLLLVEDDVSKFSAEQLNSVCSVKFLYCFNQRIQRRSSAAVPVVWLVGLQDTFVFCVGWLFHKTTRTAVFWHCGRKFKVFIPFEKLLKCPVGGGTGKSIDVLW